VNERIHWRLLGASAILVLVLVLGGNLPAYAQDGIEVDVRSELEAIDTLLQQAIRAYRLGQYEEAYRLARSAYLDHFEMVEIPLRAVEPDLTLELEYQFAELRNQMKVGAPAREVEATIEVVRQGLEDVEAMFVKAGALAPSLILSAAFIILTREGLEAVLVLAALLGYLRSVPGGLAYRRAVLGGAAAALSATMLVWVLVRFMFTLAPVARELLEAAVAFVAVGILFWTTFWLSSRYDHRRWMEFLQAKAWAAMSGGNQMALVGLGFTAIFREGLETVLFYEVLFSLGKSTQAFVWYGLAIGLLVLVLIAWLIFQSGRRLPIHTFLRTAVVMVALLSVFIIGKGVRELQEAGFMDVTLIRSLPRLPRPIAEFTGIHPTLETLAAQVALAGVYVVGWLAMRWHQARQQPKLVPESDVS
jgi:high-affinity iron transporter